MQRLQSRAIAVSLDSPPDWGEDDAALVARARQGDATAFAALYRRYVDRVYAFAARRLTDRAAAEEATQETFARALAGLGRFRTDGAFAGWLFTIAGHVVLEHFRTKRRGESPGEPIDLEDPDPTPEERLLRADAVAELEAARVRCLGQGERDLLDLLLADLTDNEIAAAIGRRPGAVRTARWRLLIKLRDCLGIRGQAKEGRLGDR
ncbi:MAG TPA: sigma-70 family RNA polymerase sigma factor [Thermomicrobiales bacterium]|nr:sigma-70 family RNA polymerase sigma factor [Thermomicrobiales bacterium]